MKTANMEERLAFIMKAKNLSMTQFAEEINIQRSNMSHVMNGRNKASLDFVSRILKRFPDINPDWLLFGKGSMHRGDDGTETASSEEVVQYKAKAEELEKEVAQLRNQLSSPQKSSENEPKEVSDEHPAEYKAELKIKSIVTFYNDDTFKIYTPK